MQFRALEEGSGIECRQLQNFSDQINFIDRALNAGPEPDFNWFQNELDYNGTI